MLKYVVCILVVLSIGCNDMSKKVINTAMDTEPDVQMDTQTATICEVGDTLKKGQTCQDPGTDAVFAVTENGNGKYTSKGGLLFEATDVLDTTGTTFNGKPYNFKATKQKDDSWKIEIVSIGTIE